MKSISPLLFLLWGLFFLNGSIASSLIILVGWSLVLFQSRKSLVRFVRSKIILASLFLLSLVQSVFYDTGVVFYIRSFVFLSGVIFFPLRLGPAHQLKNPSSFMVGLLILSQIIVAVGGQFSDLVLSFYPIDQNAWDYENDFSQNLSFIRLAGHFYNPNIFAQNLIFAFLFMALARDVAGKRLPVFIFLIVFVSGVLTGSRLFFGIFIIFSFLYFSRSIKWRTPKGLFAWILFTSIFSALFLLTLQTEFRVASHLISSITDPNESGASKLFIFLDYISELSSGNTGDWLIFLLGRLAWDRQFDAEPGYFIQSFGVLAFILFGSFVFRLFLLQSTAFRAYFSFLLICIAGTVFTNFRFEILGFIMLSALQDIRDSRLRSTRRGINFVS